MTAPDIMMKSPKLVDKDELTIADLPQPIQNAFKRHGISFRSQTRLVYEDKATDQRLSGATYGVNTYPDSKEANPDAPAILQKYQLHGVGYGGTKVDDPFSGAEFIDAIDQQYPDTKTRHRNDAAHATTFTRGDILLTTTFSGSTYHLLVVNDRPRHRSGLGNEDARKELSDRGFGLVVPVNIVPIPQGAASKSLTNMTVNGGTLERKNMDIISKHQIAYQAYSGGKRPSTDVDYTTIGSQFRQLARQPASSSHKTNSNQLLDSLSVDSAHSGLEDVVCSWVMEETGSKLKPATQYMPVVEYLFRKHRDEGAPETYAVQVKDEGLDGNRDDLIDFASSDDHDTLFLYSATGDSIEHDSIKNIDESDLTDYICSYPGYLDPTELERLLLRIESKDVVDDVL